MRVGLWSIGPEALLLLSALQPFHASAGPEVDVALKASFNSAPYLVELLETAAEENSTAYFPLLDHIADGYFDHASTDESLYNTFMRVLQDDGHLTTPEALSSFQLALSIHSAAPRIEAHYQFYRTSAEPSSEKSEQGECDTWVSFDGKQYCSPELDSAKGLIQDQKKVKLPFDRVLGASPGKVEFILYADITSTSFRRFHQVISRTAKDGASTYRVRYKPSLGLATKPLLVSGYGVELALKRTDYIVIDDRHAEKGEEGKESEENVAAETALQDDDIADLKPLSSSELLKLDLKAASFVMNSEDRLDVLSKLSQDFPKYSSAIAAYNVSSDFLMEHLANRRIMLPPGYNVIWINGVQVQTRELDAFALLEHLRRERRLVNGVRGLAFSGPEAINILSHSAVAEAQADDEPQRYDFRDVSEGGNVIMWLNDIEKDKRYSDWPVVLNSLLQRTYPGQLPPVRKDVHNLVVPIDFSDYKDVLMVAENLQNFVKRKVPIRFGLVPSTRTSAAVDQAKVVYHLLDTYGLGVLLNYLEASVTGEGKTLSSPSKTYFDLVIKRRDVRKDKVALQLREVLESDILQDRINKAHAYLTRLAAGSPNPPIFINGATISRNDEWLQAMSNRVTLDLRAIQQGVFNGSFDDDTYLPSHFLARASHRRNALVVPEDEKNIKVFDLASMYTAHECAINGLPLLLADASKEKKEWAFFIVIADFNTYQGSNLLAELAKFRHEHGGVEMAFVHNPAHVETGSTASDYLVHALKQGTIEALEHFVHDPKASFGNEVSAEDVKESREIWNSARPFVDSLGLSGGQAALVLNGRLVGPIPSSEAFAKDDLETLFAYERKKRIAPTVLAVKGLGLSDRVTTPLAAAKLSSIVALSTMSDIPEGIFEAAPSIRTNIFKTLNSTHTAIESGNIDTASVQLVASVDPTSETAQRWIPILKVLSEMSGVYMRLFLNPRDKLDELPVKRFYRHVLESKPSFDEDGTLRGLHAHFTGIPAEALLTMAMDVPPSWLVSPEDSVHDLDNIKLGALKGQSNIEAVYELEHILIEGHSRDVTLGPPPRGAQLVLGTEKDAHFADTIVMSNLGYFQFKANPGYFKLGLQPGRSVQIFNVDSAGALGYTPQQGDESTDIALTSFRGVTLYPRLSRKPGQEAEDVLEATKSFVSVMAAKTDSVLSKVGISGVRTEDYISKAQKLGSSILTKSGLMEPTPTPPADINIFSVASGHLYERMLNIMMVSVMKHTKHTVKFWFIEQFLSPSFKSFLPAVAAEYGFQYEMVTYKWPHWLRAQREKQREIWGYKILFLDVLFPLDLDKVIFVDADQIVRTDMYELVTHDLKGAPYGFTPMCDSRTEMEGFRFWKQGYWKNFLRGLPYHISALYVVDLRRFRQIAAGDRLRQQYQTLSADPASLSNLDQDLPNHMQMVLPIHSLPQEWLWCETWCSDEALKEARTIDLCNNPLTKEPKLERARRQVPEWTVYDEEIAALAKRSEKGGVGAGEEAPIADSSTSAGAQQEAEAIGAEDGKAAEYAEHLRDEKSRRLEESPMPLRRDEL